MKPKVTKHKKDTPSPHDSMAHLQNAVDVTRPASPQDCTGFTPTVPETPAEAKSYHDLMNVPVTPRCEGKKKKDHKAQNR